MKLTGKRKGQNTVEYLLMLTVVVAVVLAAGWGLKQYMPNILSTVEGLITGAAGTIGSNANK